MVSIIGVVLVLVSTVVLVFLFALELLLVLGFLFVLVFVPGFGSKGLALMGLTAIVIGISGLFQATNKINKDIEIQEAKAYNHSTENALDNVFMQDNNNKSCI